MKKAQFEIKKTKNNQYHFVLKAKNGEIILQSETYTTKQAAKAGISSIISIITLREFLIVYKT